MKVLITGSSGQLGKSLITSKGERIKLLIPDRFEFDLQDKQSIIDYIELHKPIWTINCAAYTSVDEAEDNSNLAKSINLTGVGTLAKLIKSYGGKLLQISTDFIFDGTKNRPYKPFDKGNPLCKYGLTKYQAEKEILKIFSNSNQGIILRTSWLISPYGKNFLLTILRLLKEQETISVVNDQIGSLTSCKSLADTCWELISIYSNNVLSKNLPNILHWSDEGLISWFQIACEINTFSAKIGLIEKEKEIIPISSKEFKSKAMRPMFSSLECSETKRILNKEQTKWKKSIQDILLKIKSSTNL